MEPEAVRGRSLWDLAVDEEDTFLVQLNTIDGGSVYEDLVLPGESLDRLIDQYARRRPATVQRLPPDPPPISAEQQRQHDLKGLLSIIDYGQKLKQPQRPKPSKPRATPPSARTLLRRELLPPPIKRWPLQALVIQRPEGYGKSTLVGQLARTRRVVFCARSNAQLIEHETSIRSRWPDLRVVRHASKGQNLSEAVQKLTGKPFKIEVSRSRSPYAPAQVDERATVDKLANELNWTVEQAQALFQREHEEYQAPEINGKEQDIILMTITAFQAICTRWKQAWWEVLNLYALTPNGGLPHHDRVEWNKPVNRMVVVVDDPDAVDFDWYRLIEDEVDATQLQAAKRSLSQRKKSQALESYWLDRGLPPETAKYNASWATESNEFWLRQWESIHNVVRIKDDWFERRQERGTLGFGLLQRCRRACPLMLVLTTEQVTTAYAMQTFARLKLAAAVNSKLPLSTFCNVSLIYTPLVRKRNHVLVLLLSLLLRRKFPAHDVTLIANGLGCKWNLQNTKGINSLKGSATLIKISSPPPEVARTLLAHLGPDDQPLASITRLLADMANQALGRNQGHRYTGMPAVLLVDPRLHDIENGLRYEISTWSRVRHPRREVQEGLIRLGRGGSQTPLEMHLRDLLSSIQLYALTDEALEVMADATPAQQALFLQWRKRAAGHED